MLEFDVYRQLGRTGMVPFLKLYLRDRAFRPIVTLRLYQQARTWPGGRLLYPLIWLWHRRNSRRAGMELPLGTQIGGGLLIAHGMAIVVNRQARIGRNVTLFHGVTLGQGDRISDDGSRVTGYPVIEDDVWLGPHAVVVGGVRVGSGSRILANSVVVKDVSPRSMVGGNPAVLIRADCVPDVTNRFAFADAAPSASGALAV